ncbi:MAG TPA: polyprenol phosphomannose-dependent alpha 1,6 mannosyltransferase MptB [Solirubrobacteraceae bacterium]|nr:polyprenol phosphomannose-dependent alpha 1,6 mannosyltransferase MptB [Solirubrobacteraceae bacterium]
MSSRRPFEAARDGGADAAVALLDASGSAVLDPSTPERETAPAPASIRLGRGRAQRRHAGDPPAEARLVLRGRLAITGLLATGLLVVISAANTQSFLPLSLRPLPPSLPLGGVFSGVVLDLHVAGAIAVLIAMFCSYAIAVSVSEHLSPRLVIGSIVALIVLVMLGPPLVSTDVFSYQAYARMGASYGINPYLHGPYAINLDHVFPFVGSKWSYTPSAYGPLFTVFSYALAKLSIATSVYVYKAIAGAAALGLVAVVWRCAGELRCSRTRAAALVGLNPLLIVYGVGGGHNDLLMLLAVSGALYALVRGRDRLGGVLGVAAAGVKLTGALLLPFAVAARCPKRGSDRPRELLIGIALALAVILALSFAVFGSGGFHILGTLSQGQKEGSWNSIPGFISSRLGLHTVSIVVTGLLAAAFTGVCCWLLRRVWRSQMDWIAAAGWATLAMLVSSSSLLPWYVAWMLPFAALGRDRRLARASVAMTGIVLGVQLLGFVPHGSPLF